MKIFIPLFFFSWIVSGLYSQEIHQFEIFNVSDSLESAGIFAREDGGECNFVIQGSHFGLNGTARQGFSLNNIGMWEITVSGTGVEGWASSATGATIGVLGRADSPDGDAGHFLGDLTYTGALNGPSDIRLKTILKTNTPGLRDLLKLNTKSYKYKTNQYLTLNLREEDQYGFIAQEVERIFPFLIGTSYTRTLVRYRPRG